MTEKNGSGYLEVGVNEQNEVVVNLPHDMTGHIVFSPAEARGLASSLTRKAEEADRIAHAAAEAERIAKVPAADRTQLDTTNGRPVEEVRAGQTNATGQHDGYIVLSAAERAKGFVRPYRDAYRHVGPPGPKYSLQDVDPARTDLRGLGYVKFEAYPEGSPERLAGSCVTGAYWTAARLEAAGKGCEVRTTMGRALSETYARDPKFYGATFCCGCNRHLPVEEFVWTADGQRVGS